jgi:hypothetical protein
MIEYRVKHIVKDDKFGDLWLTLGIFYSKESAVDYCSDKDHDLLGIEAYQDGELVRDYNAAGECLSHN